jgi:hypothetical protein
MYYSVTLNGYEKLKRERIFESEKRERERERAYELCVCENKGVD